MKPTSREIGPLAGVSDMDLQKGWEDGDNKPGEHSRIRGVHGSVPKGLIAIELTRRETPFRRLRVSGPDQIESARYPSYARWLARNARSRR